MKPRRRLFTATFIFATIYIFIYCYFTDSAGDTHPDFSFVYSDENSYENTNLNKNASNLHNLSFAIHISVKDNVLKFDHLWKSINNAYRIQTPVEFHIRATPTKRRQWLLDHFKSLSSVHGPIKTIDILSKGQSLRLLHSWRPNTKTEFAIFLEHDTLVSRHFLQYSEKMTLAYFFNGDEPNNATARKTIGISLSNPTYDEVHERFWNPSLGQDNAYLIQFPQTHGAVLAPLPWMRFTEWQGSLATMFNSLIPDSMTNRWHYQSMRKDLLRYMYAEGLLMIYPNLVDELCFVSRQGDSPGSKASIKNNGCNLFDASFESQKYILANLPNNLESPPNSLRTFNAYFKEVRNVSELKMNARVSSFDKCTMIMNVYDRVDTLLDRIQHYESFKQLDKLILVWNHQTYRPHFKISSILSQGRSKMLPPVANDSAQLPIYQFQIPVLILQQSNSSLNNRYLPFPEIETDCIISMDDDHDFPHHHLTYSINLFQGHFFNHAIGFKLASRSHRNLGNGKFEYITEWDKGSSIVLPTGMVFHRKYLEMYSYQLPALAREIVDSKTNGEDILFNMMIANSTKSGPVVVNIWSRGIIMKNGLWNKANHFRDRSVVLTRLVNEVFDGRNPLKFTTKFF